MQRRCHTERGKGRVVAVVVEIISGGAHFRRATAPEVNNTESAWTLIPARVFATRTRHVACARARVYGVPLMHYRD